MLEMVRPLQSLELQFAMMRCMEVEANVLHHTATRYSLIVIGSVPLLCQHKSRSPFDLAPHLPISS